MSIRCYQSCCCMTWHQSINSTSHDNKEENRENRISGMAQPFRATPARLCAFSTISRFFDAFFSSRGYECSCTWIAVPWTFGFCVRQACSEFSAAQFRRVSVLAVLFRLVQCSVPPSQTLAFAWQARRSVPPSCISFCAASVRSASVASIAALWTNPAELLLGVCLPLKKR